MLITSTKVADEGEDGEICKWKGQDSVAGITCGFSFRHPVSWLRHSLRTQIGEDEEVWVEGGERGNFGGVRFKYVEFEEAVGYPEGNLALA